MLCAILRSTFSFLVQICVFLCSHCFVNKNYFYIGDDATQEAETQDIEAAAEVENSLPPATADEEAVTSNTKLITIEVTQILTAEEGEDDTKQQEPEPEVGEEKEAEEEVEEEEEEEEEEEGQDQTRADILQFFCGLKEWMMST